MRTDIIREAVTKVGGYDPEKWQFNDDISISADGKTLHLTPWRFDRRFLAMRTLSVKDNVLRKICSYKSLKVVKCSDEMKDIVYQELDVCEWLLDDNIVSVYAQASGDKIVSLILKTQKDILCNIEIALTLSEDTAPVTKHEIVGKEGMISDRSINEQIPVESVYLFEQNQKNPKAYTDMDVTMLGLSPDEIRIADNIIEWLGNPPDVDMLSNALGRMKYLTDCVFRSANAGEAIDVREGQL